jgi:predicted methyltransferase
MASDPRYNRAPMRPSRIAPFALVLAVAACGGATSTPDGPAAPAEPGPAAEQAVAPSPEAVAIVAAADRTDEDRALDAGRKPAELITFAGLKPGMRVAELGAGGGYTTEVLARAVGPTGKVWAQNPAAFAQFVGDRLKQRLARPANAQVVEVTLDFEAPLPPEAKDLDAIFFVLLYHDLFWLKTDRAKLNAAVFAALRSGGTYVVIDHSGRPGTGSSEIESLHRIEESVVVPEIEAAGFELARRGGFLRNPDDARDWNADPEHAGARRGTSDRFVLEFVKP